MAFVDLITGFRTTFFGSFFGLDSKLEQASLNSFTLRSDTGALRQEFVGSFVLNKKGRIKSGQISSFSVSIDDQISWTVSGLDLSIDSYNNLFTTSKKSAFDGLFGGNDTFVGSGESDTLFSYAGNDSINGNGGNDIIDAGIGDDSLFGGQGSDLLLGVAGEDVLDGGDGFDDVDGGVDADLLTGGLGNDVFITRDGASPQLTAVVFDQQQSLTLFADNGIDIITDFGDFDGISANGEIVPTPFEPLSFDVSPGDPRVLRGTWQEDTLASGLNRGEFQVDFLEGQDLFFFIVTPGLAEALESQQSLADLDPSLFGSQLFVLLEPSELPA